VQNFKTVGEKILKQTPYGVRVEGTKVVMTVGRGVLTMDYQTALKLSAFLRNGGRLAKRAAGDESRKFTVFADLTDANAEELKAKIERNGKSVYLTGGE
jgi:hypothetical protein